MKTRPKITFIKGTDGRVGIALQYKTFMVIIGVDVSKWIKNHG